MGVFVGRGVVQAAEFSPTLQRIVGGWLDLGEVSNFQPSFQSQTIEFRTNRDGTNQVVASVETQTDPELALTLHDFKPDNLAIILRAKKVTVAGTAITNEALHSGTLVLGQSLFTKYPIATFTALKDSAGTPVTVNGSHYTVDTAKGKITLTNLSTYVQPFTADYTSASQTRYEPLGDALKYWSFRIDGINLVDNTSFIYVYDQVRISAAQNIGLLSQQFGEFPLNGKVIAVNGKTGYFA